MQHTAWCRLMDGLHSSSSSSSHYEAYISLLVALAVDKHLRRPTRADLVDATRLP